MKKVIAKLANLIDVKSLVTIAFTICFVVLALTGVIVAQDFITAFLIILTYYFTRKENNGEQETQTKQE